MADVGTHAVRCTQSALPHSAHLEQGFTEVRRAVRPSAEQATSISRQPSSAHGAAPATCQPKWKRVRGLIVIVQWCGLLTDPVGVSRTQAATA